jgi:predicted XRE-type DNA-binding protein
MAHVFIGKIPKKHPQQFTRNLYAGGPKGSSVTSIRAVGIITGAYLLDKRVDDYKHKRTVKWIKKFEHPIDILSNTVMAFGWLKKSADLALRVLDLLDEKRMSQAGLAARLNVSRQQVSKIVRGHENLTLETIVRLEYVLDTVLLVVSQPRRI